MYLVTYFLSAMCAVIAFFFLGVVYTQSIFELDTTQKSFMRGRRFSFLNRPLFGKQTRLDLTHLFGLQLIPQRHDTEIGEYYTYQLIFVMKNGRRSLIFNYDNPTTAKRRSTALSNFLNAPLWDVVIEPA